MCRFQAPAVQKVDNAIHRINLYPVDNVIGVLNTYPLDSDLSFSTALSNFWATGTWDFEHFAVWG